jgi:hypothetical protein
MSTRKKYGFDAGIDVRAPAGWKLLPEGAEIPSAHPEYLAGKFFAPKFACVECGFEENADLVCAINILARGHRVIAWGELAQRGSLDETGTHRRDSVDCRLSAVGIPAF